MKQKVWLARNKNAAGKYEIWTGPRPVMGVDDEEWQFAESMEGRFLKSLCPRRFHRFCKIRLRKGQCVRVKLTHLKHGFKFEVVG